MRRIPRPCVGQRLAREPRGTPRRPRRMSDEQRQMVWQLPHSAYGEAQPSGLLQPTTDAKASYTHSPQLLKTSAPVIELNLRFPGQYYDDESKLHYNYHRSYWAAQGRYTQPDPIGLEGGWNRWGYVEGNPLSLIDRDGLQIAIPAPLIGPAAGALVRPGAGTLVDPLVTPGMPDPNDPGNNQKCKNLEKRIKNLKKEIYDKRYPDLKNNPGNLPQRIGPGEALRDTVRGHEVLLNRQLRRLKELEAEYEKECLC